MTGAQTSKTKLPPMTETVTHPDAPRSSGAVPTPGSAVSGVTSPRRRLPIGAESLRGGGGREGRADGVSGVRGKRLLLRHLARRRLRYAVSVPPRRGRHAVSGSR